MVSMFRLINSNNPLTKEPKLQRASRILSEWTGYDQEVQVLRQAHAEKALKKRVKEEL